MTWQPVSADLTSHNYTCGPRREDELGVKIGESFSSGGTTMAKKLLYTGFLYS